MKVEINGTQHDVELASSTVQLNGKDVEFHHRQLSDHSHLIIYNNKTYNILVRENSEGIRLFYLDGSLVLVDVKDDLQLMLDRMGLSSSNELTQGPLKAPMPGLILDILVEDGNAVKKGDPMIILEAMKMENVIKAQTDSTVDQVLVGKSDSVEKNQPLITFK